MSVVDRSSSIFRDHAENYRADQGDADRVCQLGHCRGHPGSRARVLVGNTAQHSIVERRGDDSTSDPIDETGQDEAERQVTREQAPPTKPERRSRSPGPHAKWSERRPRYPLILPETVEPSRKANEKWHQGEPCVHRAQTQAELKIKAQNENH